ncbi:MAG TPA: ABC transporter ATP-binding protein [Candidatus Paceibacterota bacterium]|nr:ABC transporter ATP-binding protein [Verrucomicrobiota bacterium]HRY51480.1 ABC transporter ATP-binding protein [Candidatus Paceibacterota bacterium]HSA02033.1 ABC transporter ATP-binding protein [Candidatus Paceibacterota bacterium]
MTALREMIRFQSVSRRFWTEARGEVWAVRDFNIRCAEEEWSCLLGPSGCGKTTLLRLAAGLDQPTEGHVLVEDVQVTRPRMDVAFLSQEGDLLPWRNVRDNVGLGLEIRGFPQAECRQRAREAIRRVRLPEETARSRVDELSGGMRQRVAVARALCVNPRVLLMDEPFARLDELTRHQLQEELMDLWLTDRQTVLFVTHSIEEAVFLADRIIVMNAGMAAVDLRVTLPRPRDRFSSDFVRMMRQVREALSQPANA